MLIPYTENDFVYRSDSLDEILEFLRVYGDLRVEGLRSELNKLVLQSKKTGQFFESSKCGFWVGQDPRREDIIIYKENLYDPTNLFFILFDLLVTPFHTSAEEELEVKLDALNRYFKKAEEMEGESFQREKEEIETILRELVVVSHTYSDDEDEFSEEELERFADLVDKLYYERIDNIIKDLVSRTAEPRINIKVDPPGMFED